MTTEKFKPTIAEIEAMLSSITPQPGEAYYQCMQQAPWLNIGIKPTGFLRQRKAAVMIGGAMVIMLLLGILLTPAGSVLADQVLRFFNRVQGNTISIPADQITTPVPTRTPEATQYQAILPVDQMPTPTATMDARELPASDWITGISLMEAQALVDWELYQPMELPEDYHLDQINYDETRESVQMSYSSPKSSSGEFFMISQGENLELPEISERAEVVAIPVGDNTAELVRGMWWNEDGSNKSTWVDQAGVFTIQWQQNDVAIRIVFMMNDDFYPAYLNQDQMVAVAQSLAQCPSAEKFTCQLQQMSAAVGFKPWQFSNIPEGFTFQRVDYRDSLASLWYTKGAEQLTVSQANYNFAIRETDAWYSVPEAAIQPVTVNGAAGEYVKGQLMPAKNGNQAVWDPAAKVESLRWKHGNYWFQIVYSGGEVSDNQQLLITYAESLREETPLPTPIPQPIQVTEDIWSQVYTNLEDVKPLVDFEVFEPTILPEGIFFSHVRYISTGTLMLFYGDFAADLMHSNGPVLMINFHRLKDPEPVYPEMFPPEAIEHVIVNGIPAKLTIGTIQTSMAEPGQPTPEPIWVNDEGSLALTWKENGIGISISYQSSNNKWRITKADLIAIAESLQ